MHLEVLWDDLDKPVALVSPPGDGRVFVVEQAGTVRVAATPTSPLSDGKWLDITGDVGSSAPEQGLLGLAFHPDFTKNGKLYVNYTNTDGDTLVDEIIVSKTTGTSPAVLQSRRTLLELDQPYANHNGGNIVFGPDGLAWIGTGDGGSADDPENRAQNPDSLFGKMLRLDVDSPGSTPEVWALGLRNPWRYTFDRTSKDLWIADVGQDNVEEINAVRASRAPGGNFGWPAFEGSRVNREQVSVTSHIAPVAEYGRDEGCAVTGGYVYRGPSISELDGRYVYGDFCSGRIWTLDAAAPGRPLRIDDKIGAEGLSVSSFGEDAEGRLYVVDHAGRVLVFTTDAQPAQR